MRSVGKTDNFSWDPFRSLKTSAADAAEAAEAAEAAKAAVAAIVATAF